MSETAALSKRPEKTVRDVCRELGRYSIDAFEFLSESLDYTVRKKHGPHVDLFRQLIQWLEKKSLDASRLVDLHERGELPKTIVGLIQKQGGVQKVAAKLNLHVSGADLCWGLRDLSLEQWGLMASAVLQYWGVRSTQDIGRMVFALVDNGLLQKQPDDSINDFDDVYDFRTAFDESYRVDLSQSEKKIKSAE